MAEFTFNISLSILNHLGRNLYRSIMTVLGEAISNSWDADAENVFITINRASNMIVIRDDGAGMTDSDFQNKFLKIGYSKRKGGMNATKLSRPYIGRKGIGKLALLSCAQRITVLSKINNGNLIGGVIDNAGLDEAIKDDVSTNDYKLGEPNDDLFAKYDNIITHGTVIIFDGLTDGIKNRVEYIRNLIALYFRFSIIDPNFTIHLNDTPITIEELKPLADSTQFLWNINNLKDPYIEKSIIENTHLKKNKSITSDLPGIKGFLASVEKPSMVKVKGTEEKTTVDLYVNGRLREKDILRHIPSTRIVENYLYGQLHYDELDDEVDRFTSSREGVISDDPKFVSFLKEIETIMKTIIEDWDKWRTELKQDGDPDNDRISRKERKSRELVNEVANEFIPSEEKKEEKQKVEQWINELNEDAQFNVSSYTECFVAENLLRKYVKEKAIALPEPLSARITQWKQKHKVTKEKANIFFDIRTDHDDLFYCEMDNLAELATTKEDRTRSVSFTQDAKEYKPIRDALCHTSRLTKDAKAKLTSTFANIKARITQLLGDVTS